VIAGVATMKHAIGGREREREIKKDSVITSLSPLFSATHKKMSSWLDTKEAFYSLPPPPSFLYISPVTALFTNLSPLFTPSKCSPFLSLSLSLP